MCVTCVYDFDRIHVFSDKMFNGHEVVSAFAIYSSKRKKQNDSGKAKKVKKQHKVSDVSASINDNKMQKKVKNLNEGKTEKRKGKTDSTFANGIHSQKQKQSSVKRINKKTNLQKTHVIQGVKKQKILGGLKNKDHDLKVESLKLAKKVKKIKQDINKSGTDSEEYSFSEGSRGKEKNLELSRTVQKSDKKQKKVKQDKHKKEESPQVKVTKEQLQENGKQSVDLNKSFSSELGCHYVDPTEEGKKLFEWLIYPLKADDFFQNNWENTPLQVKRTKKHYYKMLMSTPMLDKILRDNFILFGKNIDITSYSDGVRETHNPPGRAVPSVVWDYYMNGCSVRMLNPQTFIPKLHTLNATLQEYFGCFVGANSYLTPPDSQGFAPHYDDIEAFILQIEGKKRWRLYKPRYDGEYLPRYSSKNFDQSEIGEPIMDTVLNAGDLLYFPRGTIHQGETIDGTHSLHITLSVYQKNSYGDFLEKLLPETLKRVIETNSEFREGLPLGYLKHTGFVHSDDQSEERKLFADKVKGLLKQMIDQIDVDAAADQMAKGHIHDFLPPTLNSREQECSVVKDGEWMVNEGEVVNRVEIEPDTKIRLARSHCIRLVAEEGSYRIYYSTENSKEYHEYEPQFLEVSEEFVDAVKEIILRYPEFIRVDDLPIEGEDNKMQLVKDLWEKCIVVTEEPLEVLEV